MIETKAQHGIEQQVERLKKGFDAMNLLGPAKLNNGIYAISDNEQTQLVEKFRGSGDSVVKFVPASGAATRMFKSLQKAISDGEASKEVELLKERIADFAFGEDAPKDVTPLELASYLIGEEGMNFAGLPKGLVPFHSYDNETRTAFEEHLVETTQLTGNAAKVHFTVAENHLEKIKETVSSYLSQNGLDIKVEYSFQDPATNTVAIDSNGNVLKDDQKIIYRPAGHGALLQNLNAIDADVIFIKNIDNVVSETQLGSSLRFKQILGGKLIELKESVHHYAELLLNTPNEKTFEEALNFIGEQLGVELNLDNNNLETSIQLLYRFLNRPIRVCGMVKNEGEPGGGPFWVKDVKWGRSLQIVEQAQIQTDSQEQMRILQESTHFNPVDIVCSVKDYKGKKFDLQKYVDEETGIVTEKTYNGKPIKALELPGLWNGSMADWITIFVEVPLTTFNPVKTVFDLLKPAHQAG